jgi:hypothetical protein
MKIVLDFDRLVNAGNEPENAIKEMRKKEGMYDPELLKNISDIIIRSDSKRRTFINKDVTIDRLREDMYLAEDVVSAAGVILGSKNQKVTKALIITLKNYEKNMQLKEI